MQTSTGLKGYTLCDAWRTTEHMPLRILLADDDANMRHLVATDLRQDGSEVIEAADGLDALDRFRQSFEAGPSLWFDVVLSDFKMPNLGGLKLLSILRTECAFTPFILMSAFVDAKVQQEAERLGAWTVLRKPVDLESLYLAVHRAV
jgi:CheY-like chemotaxis protein